VGGSGISCAICKSSPRPRQIPIPAPHHSIFFYKLDALPATQPTASKPWRNGICLLETRNSAVPKSLKVLRNCLTSWCWHTSWVWSFSFTLWRCTQLRNCDRLCFLSLLYTKHMHCTFTKCGLQLQRVSGNLTKSSSDAKRLMWQLNSLLQMSWLSWYILWYHFKSYVELLRLVFISGFLEILHSHGNITFHDWIVTHRINNN